MIFGEGMGNRKGAFSGNGIDWLSIIDLPVFGFDGAGGSPAVAGGLRSSGSATDGSRWTFVSAAGPLRLFFRRPALLFLSWRVGGLSPASWLLFAGDLCCLLSVASIGPTPAGGEKGVRC